MDNLLLAHPNTYHIYFPQHKIHFKMVFQRLLKTKKLLTLKKTTELTFCFLNQWLLFPFHIHTTADLIHIYFFSSRLRLGEKRPLSCFPSWPLIRSTQSAWLQFMPMESAQTWTGLERPVSKVYIWGSWYIIHEWKTIGILAYLL